MSVATSHTAFFNVQLSVRSFSSIAAGEGPVCVVTGSARGIGKAIALALGASGARVLA